MMAASNEEALSPVFLRKLERLSLSAKRPVAGQMKGDKRSTKKGTGIDFADYREYSPGDDLRYVDWNTAARTDRLYLKLCIEEEDLYLALLPDTSMSMGFGEPAKLTTALRLATALGYIGLCNYDRVSVQPYAEILGKPLPLQRGRSAVPAMFQYMRNIQPAGATAFGHSLKRFAAASRSRGMAVVLSDFMNDDWETGLKALAARGFQVTVLHLLSQEEMQPAIRGDLKLIDCETNSERELSVHPRLLERYQQVLNTFCSDIQSFCSRYGMNYLFIPSHAPLETLILQTLRRTGLVQ